jgi:hypothetical protein
MSDLFPEDQATSSKGIFGGKKRTLRKFFRLAKNEYALESIVY